MGNRTYSVLWALCRDTTAVQCLKIKTDQIVAENPEINSAPSQQGDEPTGPTYKRHKIFDPIRNKNILVPVPNTRLSLIMTD